MAWNSSEQLLWLPFTKIAENGQGDLQLAFDRPWIQSEEQLLMDVDAGGNVVGKINKWAKYKPIRRSQESYEDQLKEVDGVLWWKTEAELAAELKVPWWIGDDGQCGLSFQVFPDLYPGSNPLAANSFFDHLLRGDILWEYARLRSRDIKRCYDCHQYFAGAPKPIEGIPTTISVTPDYEMTIYLDENRGNQFSLHLSDFSCQNVSLSNFYAGVLIHYNGTVTFKSSGRIGDGNLIITFTNMQGYIGHTVDVVPFLSSLPIQQGVNPGAGMFISADVAPKSVTVDYASSGITLNFTPYWFGPEHYDVKVPIIIGNTLEYDYVVSGVKVHLFSSAQGWIRTVTLGDIPIVSQGTYEHTVNFFDLQIEYDPDTRYYVEITCTDGSIHGEEDVEDPRR